MLRNLKSGFIFSVLVSSFSLYANSALAGAIQNPILTGQAQGYAVSTNPSTPNLLVAVTGPLNQTQITNLLSGDASSPGGNVELGKLGFVAATTLSGTLDGTPIVLSSLVQSDWTDTLTNAFIKDAAKTVNFYPNKDELNTIRTTFISGQFWRSVSDPNISYVYSKDGLVRIGLAGFMNATPVLIKLFSQYVTIDPGIQLQVSEVVKISYGAIKDRYYYSFHATPSGLATSDGSYSGNYEITIPEPSIWLLILSALFALTGVRVLRSHSV